MSLDDLLMEAARRSRAATSDYDLNPGVVLPGRRVLRDAAVLVGVMGEGFADARVLLTRRSARLKHHPGQVAFPGGKVDPGDVSPEAAALREAAEEVGLPGGAATVIGRLKPHETVTGFTVTPILARLARFDPVPEAGEVAEVFTVPLAFLADPANYTVEQRDWRGATRRYYAVPFGPWYVWGATARILRGLADGLAVEGGLEPRPTGRATA